MTRPLSYNTKQREAVLAYVISLGNTHVTAAQIVRHFQNAGISVGRTTIYRHLEKLVRDKKLRKYNVDGITGACYQYTDIDPKQQKHLLLKCEDCGGLVLLNCGVLDEIHRHIYKDHTFKVNVEKTVFYGKCQSCFAHL